MNELSDVDLAWLAGIFEGEATVGAWPTNNYARNNSRIKESKTTQYARIEISSTDPDVVTRLIQMTGIGNVHKHYDGNKKESHKKSNTWRVAKAEHVVELLNALEKYGFYSSHRSEQMAECREAATLVANRKKSGESYRRKKG